ncbi:MAG: hydantoinase/oxoprolinase family protein [Pseudomonadota bacterium]
MSVQIAVDIGGTFTDGVLLAADGTTIGVAKALTTPDQPGDAVVTVVKALLSQGIERAQNVVRVVHGTTLVTNTLVERNGARCALLVTPGTEDSLDIRRELRYDTYDLDAAYPSPLIARADRYAIPGRLGPDGQEWHPLDLAEAERVIERALGVGYDAIGVCLLHAPINDRHEQAIGDLLSRVASCVPTSLSSNIAREIGEFERMSTVAANVYVQPIVSEYIATLNEQLHALGIPGALHIMLSDGAFTTADFAAAAPVRILESGPAGGVLSAVNCAALEGIDKVVAFDMGGTTAKACVAVEGKPSITHTFEFARVQRFHRGSGLPAVTPSIDLIEIGAGGGSLAAVNALGLLQVGPQSAGADPGPACYGQGGESATVTDADLILGFLDPDDFLGGRMTLDRDLAETALAHTGAPLGLDAEATALGIHRIVNENMAAAARTHIAERGFDARDFTLVATGGAGPVHAVDVAHRLRIARVLCPIASGVGSCLGFLAAPARAVRTWSKVETLAELDVDDLATRLAHATGAVTADLSDCGLCPAEIRWALSAAIRYVGQGDTVEVAVASDPAQPLDALDIHRRFDGEYQRLYHKTVPGGEPEIVTWRLVGSSEEEVREFHFRAEASDSPPPEPTMRSIFRHDLEAYDDVPVYPRNQLAPGTTLHGPLIVTEDESTLVVARVARVTVLASYSVLVELDETNHD